MSSMKKNTKRRTKIKKKPKMSLTKKDALKTLGGAKRHQKDIS